MRDIYIVNPHAGKKGAAEAFAETVKVFHEKNGGAYEVQYTEYAGHGEVLARQAAETGENVRIWAVGGDGTLLEVARGAAHHKNAAVGVFPRGSGNDFVRMFGGREAFLNMERQHAGRAVCIDMIRTGHGGAANICSLGFDAKVADRMADFRRLPLVKGELSYILALAVTFFSSLSDRMEITLENELGDTEHFSGDYMVVLAGNGQWYGGGFHAAPKADLSDGLLDFVLITRPALWRIPKLLGMYKRGEHLDDESCADVIPYRRGRWIEVRGEGEFVSNMDGNCVHVQDTERYEILPGALNFIVPEDAV